MSERRLMTDEERIEARHQLRQAMERARELRDAMDPRHGVLGAADAAFAADIERIVGPLIRLEQKILRAAAEIPGAPGDTPASRPDGAEHLPPPALQDAVVMAGVLCHYVGGSAELRTRLARWLEHHEGDLDEQLVLWYLTECHKLLEPECTLPIDGDMHPGRTR